jgi:hypothetical protein
MIPVGVAARSLALPLLLVVVLWTVSPLCSAWTPSSYIAHSSHPRKQHRHSRTRSHAVSILSELDAFWQTSPYTAAAIACGVKASAADMVAQQQTSNVFPQEDDEEEAFFPVPTTTVTSSSASTDWTRNAAFLLYGSLYQGMTQEFVYNHLYPLWFGTGMDPQTVLVKVAFDLLVQTTLLTLPVAYLIKGSLFGNSPATALSNYAHDVRHEALWQKYFALWGPVQCLTFSVVPEHYRVTFIAFISFFWLIVLSNISSKQQQTTRNTTTNSS